MVVLRQDLSNARIDAKDTRNIANTQVQDAQNKGATTVSVGDSSGWRANLVQSIAGTLVKVGEKAVGVAQENAYLEGQAKAGRIQSEDELEGNFLTKDWAVAGYRDTMGKLAMADSEARMAVDMRELRTQGPEAMEAYLAKRRGELTPVFASLSRESRANMFGQLLMGDRAAIAKHTGEHRAYIIDTANKGIRAGVIADTTGLTSLQTDVALGKAEPAAYGEAINKFATGIYTSVWNNPMFKNEPGLKSKLTTEALTHALDNDHLAAYEFFRDNSFVGADGTKKSLLAELDDGEATKLGKSYLEAKKRTLGMREAGLITQKAQVEALIHNGEYNGTWDEFSGFVDRLQVAGVINAKGSEEMQQKFFQQAGKNNDIEGLASAFIRNDTQYLTSSGKSQADAADALDKKWAKAAKNGSPVPVQAQVGILLEAANNGSIEAGKRIGSRVGPSLMQLSRADGTMDQQHVQIMDSFNKAYENSNPIMRLQMTSGMSDEEQNRFLALRENMRSLPVDAALKRVLAGEERTAKMTKQERAAASQVKDTDIVKELEDFDSQGFIMSVKNKLIPTERNRLKAVLQPDERWWGNNTGVEDYAFKMKSEVLMEANALKLANPELNASSLVTKAASAVANRTLRTDQGPLFLPRDSTPNSFFGVHNSIPNEVISKAIDKIAKPATAGNRISYEVALGGVAWVEHDRDGNATSRRGILDPKSVAVGVDELMKAETAKSSQIHGSGKTIQQDTAGVTFNGENAAGVEPSAMFKFRDNLVKHEGVRNVPYKDLSGKLDKSGNPIMTVGVGVSSHNPFYPKPGPDGKIDQAAINDSFRKASNWAAVEGSRIQQKMGIQGDSAFLLFSEFSYQGRGGTFNELANAIANKDKDAAMKFLKTTTAYGYSKGARRQNYEKLVLSALEGK